EITDVPGGGGASIRGTQPGATYPAGTAAGVGASANQNPGVDAAYYLRTYLAGALQEEHALEGLQVANINSNTGGGDQLYWFATLPVEPGQPGGIAVDGDTVYVDTFGFVVRPADGHDNVYSFQVADGAMRTDRTNPIQIPRRFQVCLMGMSGMAVDGDHRLYL